MTASATQHADGHRRRAPQPDPSQQIGQRGQHEREHHGEGDGHQDVLGQVESGDDDRRHGEAEEAPGVGSRRRRELAGSGRRGARTRTVVTCQAVVARHDAAVLQFECPRPRALRARRTGGKWYGGPVVGAGHRSRRSFDDRLSPSVTVRRGARGRVAGRALSPRRGTPCALAGAARVGAGRGVPLHPAGRATGRGAAVGAGTRPHARLQPGRPGPAVRAADHRDGRAGGALREPLSRRTSAGGPLLRLALRLHGGDAGRRPQRQRPHAVRLLGADRLHVVPPHRLRARARRRAVGGAAGADRDRRRRAGAAGSGRPARRRDGHDQPLGDGRQPRRHRGASIRNGNRGPGAAGGVHQERPGAVPLLAAERDGGADAGQRLPAFGDDGEGRHLPRRPDDADPRRHAVLDDGGDRRRRRRR